MARIIIGDDVGLDLDQLIESRLLVQAQSGGGKTTLLRRILEQTHGKVQQLVIDPEGEFYTLREKFDYVIAGKGGDCAADPRSAKLLARRLLELGVSAVCDLYELKAHERVKFVRYFLEALVEAPRELRHPVLVVIDEAHIFCPEKGQAESAAAVIDICARGRKRGLCPLLATQRLSKLHKDAAAELRNVLVGATGLDIDQVRAGDVLGFSKADRLALRDLKWREFYAYGPALSPGVIRLTVGETLTQNPKQGRLTQNPKQGRTLGAPAAPTAKIKALLQKVADLPAEAEAEARDNESLRRELADARRKLRLAEKAQRVETKECEHPAEIRILMQERDELMTKESVFVRELSQAAETFRQFPAAVMATRIDDVLRDHVPFTRERDVPTRVRRVPQNVPVKHEPMRTRLVSAPVSQNGHSDLSKSMQAILDTLAVLEGIGVERPHKSIVAVFSGASPTSGGYFNNLGKLRSSGLLDYPEASAVALTDAGRAKAAPTESITTLDALHDAWYRRVPAPQQSILRELVRVYPDDIAKEELAVALGVSPTSGGYFNNLGRLRSLGAVDYPSPGRVAATTLLFPEGLL